MSEDRYLKKLSKTLQIEQSILKNLLIKHKNLFKEPILATDKIAKNLNTVFEDIEKQILIKAIKDAKIKKQNPYALKNKNKIINLYQGDECNLPKGYKAIYNKLLLKADTDEERDEVISPSTISRYLHYYWDIPKNENVRIPKEAIATRKKV